MLKPSIKRINKAIIQNCKFICHFGDNLPHIMYVHFNEEIFLHYKGVFLFTTLQVFNFYVLILGYGKHSVQ